MNDGLLDTPDGKFPRSGRFTADINQEKRPWEEKKKKKKPWREMVLSGKNRTWQSTVSLIYNRQLSLSVKPLGQSLKQKMFIAAAERDHSSFVLGSVRRCRPVSCKEKHIMAFEAIASISTQQ